LSNEKTVNSFSIRLEGFEQAFQAEQPIQWVESRLMAQLEHPVRLLRWAIVKVEKVETTQTDHQSFWCEGAYLRSDTKVSS